MNEERGGQGSGRAPLGSTLRVLRPAADIYAFYDGRVEGARAFSDAPNWLDDGAYALGACSYAIVDGSDALVYDTHMSLPHATIVRRTLEAAGVRTMRVVLSHWHADHVAGNAMFADCDILANARTAEILAARRLDLESGTPPIRPLVLPNRTFERDFALQVGGIEVELRSVDIHSRDGTVLLLPESGLLFAGDALEDPVTYVAEPERLGEHLRDLRRMATWSIRRILPNHGSPDIIARGGYGPELVQATIRYVESLLESRIDPVTASRDLRSFMAADFATGTIGHFEPYEAVHRRNVDAVLSHRGH